MGTVVDGREQFGIEACLACKGLGISAISLARIVVDGSELSSIGHENIVPQIFELLTDPA